MKEKLLVLGGDAAGMSAASQARRRRPADDLDIVIVEQGNYTSYSACGIPYYVGDVVPDATSLIARDAATFESRYGMRVLLRHRAIDIDLDRRAVHVRDLDGGQQHWEGFDQLMVATGAVPARPPLLGADAAGVHGVQTLDDGVALRQRVDAERPERAVVVGGGYIGLEMAEALVQRGVHVWLVEAREQPMGTLDQDMGALVAGALRDIGVEVCLGEPVEAFDTAGGRVRAVVTSERTLPADLVVLGLGVRPNTGLAARSGIPVGPAGGVAVDRRMRVGPAPVGQDGSAGTAELDGLWSAGDCVESFHLVSRRPVHVPLGTHANKQGRAAGINIGGGYATFPGVLGTAMSKICGVEVARTGLTEAEASAAGFSHVTVTVESTTRAGYYPGAVSMQTKLIAERRSGRLLGAQIVGAENAAKRIDVAAVALWHAMTVEEMTGLDLGYAPPFAPVWDPVLIAARKATERVEDTMPGCR